MPSEFSWTKILGDPKGEKASPNVPPPLEADAVEEEEAAPPIPIEMTSAPVGDEVAELLAEIETPDEAADGEPEPDLGDSAQTEPQGAEEPSPTTFSFQATTHGNSQPFSTVPAQPQPSKSIFDSLPPVGSAGPPKQEDIRDLVLDPRNGLPLDGAPIADTLNVVAPADEPKPVEAAKPKEPHYRPAAVPMSVHEIDVSEKRYEHADLLGDVREVEADAMPVADAHIDDILRMAIDRKGSDIHLTNGLPPMIRLDGEIVQLPYTVLTPEETRRLIYDTLSDDNVQKFENTHELDFAYSIKGLARFRFNVYMQRGAVTGALRVIPTKIPSFDVLGLPPIVREISKRSSGLILVTGPTGSGKSTTIASMIDDINETRTSHIITIEDPIEYLHRHKKCMVNQREMHADTFSFHASLRAVLREDPDIILVGELRDLETIEAALTMAETGHLVFGTLHTRNAPSTIDRIIDVFPSDQQDQIRVLLGNTLEAVVSQQLIPKLGGGRCAAIEVMIGTPAIKNLTREGQDPPDVLEHRDGRSTRNADDGQLASQPFPKRLRFV